VTPLELQQQVQTLLPTSADCANPKLVTEQAVLGDDLLLCGLLCRCERTWTIKDQRHRMSSHHSGAEQPQGAVCDAPPWTMLQIVHVRPPLEAASP
jgi:hypothetical protein